MDARIEQINKAKLFGLLSDPSRISLLSILIAEKEICVGELSKQAGLSMSATSHQLRKLEFLGIVTRCRYGQEICYCINNKSSLAQKLIKLINS